jgi:hypothetical protein
MAMTLLLAKRPVSSQQARQQLLTCGINGPLSILQIKKLIVVVNIEVI